MRRRRAQYTPARGPVDPAGRIVIVVDDGLATGATMIAALHSMRARDPKRLICAVPVASPEAVRKVRPYADEVVCLETPEVFYAVGQFYRLFMQVDDDEVIALLNASTCTTAPAAHRLKRAIAKFVLQRVRPSQRANHSEASVATVSSVPGSSNRCVAPGTMAQPTFHNAAGA